MGDRRGKMEVKPPNRGAGDGPTPTKEGRERYNISIKLFYR